MAPPVKAMVNALGHCGGCTPPNLNAIWTLQGSRSPIVERSSPIPERAGDSILSSRHRHGASNQERGRRMRNGLGNSIAGGIIGALVWAGLAGAQGVPGGLPA